MTPDWLNAVIEDAERERARHCVDATHAVLYGRAASQPGGHRYYKRWVESLQNSTSQET